MAPMNRQTIATILSATLIAGCASTSDDGTSVANNGAGNFFVMGDFIVNKVVGPGCSSGVGVTGESGANAGGSASVNPASRDVAAQGTTAAQAVQALSTTDTCPPEPSSSPEER